MKLSHSLFIAVLSLGLVTTVNAETTNKIEKGSAFHFSTQVSRTVEKDLMTAEVYSRKSGKKLSDLKKTVSTNLNRVLEQAKKHSEIELFAEGITNYADYDSKGKIIGWVAEGKIRLISKNFDAVAEVLENLGEDVAISYVDFSVSKEKSASLEDEMTLEIVKQFQHKAELIQKSLNASKYTLRDVQLHTPNGENYHQQPRMYAMSAKAATFETNDSLPLEAGKQTISATASGKVVFE